MYGIRIIRSGKGNQLLGFHQGNDALELFTCKTIKEARRIAAHLQRDRLDDLQFVACPLPLVGAHA